MVAARPPRSARDVISASTGRAGRALPVLRQPKHGEARGGDRADVEPRSRRRVQREPDQGSARAAHRASTGEGAEVDLHVVGKKGIGYFRYVNRPVKNAHRHHRPAHRAPTRASLVETLMAEFAPRHARRGVRRLHAKSALSSPPASERVSCPLER